LVGYRSTSIIRPRHRIGKAGGTIIMMMLSSMAITHRFDPAGRLSALAVVCLAAGACGRSQVIRTSSAPVPLVSATFAGSLPALRARILDRFGGGHTLPEPFDRMTATALAPPQYAPDWADTAVDPGGFLDPYRKLSPAQRQHDILIQDPIGEVYWVSEYSTAQGPVRFRCGFILHFVDRESPSPPTTEIQIYELVPTVWVGERWSLSAHGIGFGRHRDIRFVEPTTRDRQDVVTLLERLLTR
jgi:hypothetical protein